MTSKLISLRSNRLLGRPLIVPFDSRSRPITQSIQLCFRFDAERPNARHHPRPNSTYMRGNVMGRRVHAVVMLRVPASPLPSPLRGRRRPFAPADGTVEAFYADGIGAERARIGMNPPVAELAAFPPMAALPN
jgi:hypothetical protein